MAKLSNVLGSDFGIVGDLRAAADTSVIGWGNSVFECWNHHPKFSDSVFTVWRDDGMLTSAPRVVIRVKIIPVIFTGFQHPEKYIFRRILSFVLLPFGT
jgi:hypothetical protein